MQERRLRPGDVLDDYCPRERRITDHAVVAIVDDEVRRTRCVTCDTEHEYKRARVPARRKKVEAGLFAQVLDTLQGVPVRVAAPVRPAGDLGSPDGLAVGDELPQAAEAAPQDEAPAQGGGADPGGAGPVDGRDEARLDEIPFRRTLIRAQLPRLDNQPPPARPVPEFTIRQTHNGRGRRRAGPSGFRGPMRAGRPEHGSGGRGFGVGPGRGSVGRAAHGPAAARRTGRGRGKKR